MKKNLIRWIALSLSGFSLLTIAFIQGVRSEDEGGFSDPTEHPFDYLVDPPVSGDYPVTFVPGFAQPAFNDLPSAFDIGLFVYGYESEDLGSPNIGQQISSSLSYLEERQHVNDFLNITGEADEFGNLYPTRLHTSSLTTSNSIYAWRQDLPSELSTPYQPARGYFGNPQVPDSLLAASNQIVSSIVRSPTGVQGPFARNEFYSGSSTIVQNSSGEFQMLTAYHVAHEVVRQNYVKAFGIFTTPQPENLPGILPFCPICDIQVMPSGFSILQDAESFQAGYLLKSSDLGRGYVYPMNMTNGSLTSQYSSNDYAIFGLPESYVSSLIPNTIDPAQLPRVIRENESVPIGASILLLGYPSYSNFINPITSLREGRAVAFTGTNLGFSPNETMIVEYRRENQGYFPDSGMSGGAAFYQNSSGEWVMVGVIASRTAGSFNNGDSGGDIRVIPMVEQANGTIIRKSTP